MENHTQKKASLFGIYSFRRRSAYVTTKVFPQIYISRIPASVVDQLKHSVMSKKQFTFFSFKKIICPPIERLDKKLYFCALIIVTKLYRIWQ